MRRRPLRVLAADALALVRAYRASSGTFTHRGVRFTHTGLLLDQQRAAAAVDRVAGALQQHGLDAGRTADTLRRVRVRITAEHPRPHGVPLDVHAQWSGGLLDRGEVLLRAGDGWEDRLVDALAQLLLLELDPDLAARMRSAPRGGPQPVH